MRCVTSPPASARQPAARARSGRLPRRAREPRQRPVPLHRAAAEAHEHLVTDRRRYANARRTFCSPNYKMLDFPEDPPGGSAAFGGTTSRARYAIWWWTNLLTFDGPQGTDLACLLRRLRERLQVPRQESPGDGLISSADLSDVAVAEFSAKGCVCGPANDSEASPSVFHGGLRHRAKASAISARRPIAIVVTAQVLSKIPTAR